MNNNEISGIDEVQIEMENTPLDDLETEFVNLIFVGIDGSGSMKIFTQDMQNALVDFKESLTNSKDAEGILVARADFGNGVIDVRGYKKIDSFETDYFAEGSTPLYDVIVEGTKRLLDYKDFLRKNGSRVKAVFAIFSDGQDYLSKNTFGDAKLKIEELNKQEITTAFISFGNDAKDIANQLGFHNELTVGNSATELRKAFNVLSKSVIDSSKSVVPDGSNFFQM
jgi:uncharacterized protein YegL